MKSSRKGAPFAGEENLRRCQSLALVCAWSVCPGEWAESQYGVRATQAGSLSDPFTLGERGWHQAPQFKVDPSYS